MDKNEKIFSRRQMLEMAIGFGGLTIFGGSIFAQKQNGWLRRKSEWDRFIRF